jgi:transposase InsO family protein
MRVVCLLVGPVTHRSLLNASPRKKGIPSIYALGHTVLTDNGIQFGDSIQHRSGPTARYRLHMFDRVCREHEIEHRFTKPNHPWTNGQVERMNCSLKEATVKRYHYDTHRQLEQHLAAFLDAYNFAKRLKTLRGLTPYEAICKAWADTPASFRYDPFGTEHLEQIPVNFTHSQRA